VKTKTKNPSCAFFSLSVIINDEDDLKQSIHHYATEMFVCGKHKSTSITPRKLFSYDVNVDYFTKVY
jgi:hypothetical protein